MNWSFLSNFAITLFALLNPLGMLPIFIGYTARESREVQRLIALFLSLTVLALLLIFMLTGSAILNFFGVSLNSFRVAGGILLLLIGIKIVNGTGATGTTGLMTKDNQSNLSNLSEAKSIYRQIVIPMAMPLLVGPGVIANVILYANEAQVKKEVGLDFGLIIMSAVVSFSVFVILAAGKGLQRLIGDIGISITQRVMGLFVAAIGVQFLVTGVSNIIIYNIVPEVLKLLK